MKFITALALLLALSSGCDKNPEPGPGPQPGKANFQVDSVELCEGSPCVSIKGVTDAEKLATEKAKVEVVLKLAPRK
jgi:hypothetical protein